MGRRSDPQRFLSKELILGNAPGAVKPYSGKAARALQADFLRRLRGHRSSAHAEKLLIGEA